MGIGDQQQELRAVSKTGTGAESFVIGKVATHEVDARAELGEQVLVQHFARLLLRGVDHVELDMHEGTDGIGGLADFTFQDDKAPVVKGCQSADAIGILALGALNC